MSKEESESQIDRRKFMVKLSLSLAGISAAVVSLPVISALIAPLLEEKKQQWRNIGRVDQFPVHSTKLITFVNSDPKSYAGVTAKSAAWIRRDSETQFTAFAANCTHLGCPVRWEEQAHLFMCPCHGGVYYKDGTVAAGPPPKPLPQYEIKVHKGEVQLKTAPMPITTTVTLK
jgi:menaquinol-cytochrome c reductase iron-sulfur subunit